jgi:hypothetical protein
MVYWKGNRLRENPPVESDGTAAQNRAGIRHIFCTVDTSICYGWAFLFRVFLFPAVCPAGEFQMVSPQPIPLPTGHVVVNPMEKQMQGL